MLDFKKIIKKANNAKVFEIPKNSNFKKLVSRKTALLFRVIWPLGICDSKRYKKLLGYSFKYSPLYAGTSGVFMDFDEIDNEGAILLKLYERDKNIFLKLALKCEKEGKKLLDFTYGVKKKNLSGLSDKELKIPLQNYYEKVINFSIFLMMPLAAQKFLEDSIDAELKKHSLSDMRFTEYRNILCVPNKQNIGFNEQKNILKLALEFKKKGLTKGLERKIAEHAFQYGQIGCKCGIGSLWTAEDIKERIIFLSKSKPEKRLKDLEGFDENKGRKIKEVLKAISANKRFIDLLKIAQTYIYLRTFRQDMISGSFANLTPLIEELGGREGLTRSETLNSLPQEILGKPDKTVIKKRKDVIVRGFDGAVYYAENEVGKKITDRLLKHFGTIEEKSEGKEIKGSVANRGAIRGVVKVIHDNSDLSKVEIGDIIVASMTTPDFVPAMEKAGGFITDEGGILCHAAIISREMNKPCIIGTKVATKVLKDGVMVEVDANKGIVKIIK